MAESSCLCASSEDGLESPDDTVSHGPPGKLSALVAQTQGVFDRINIAVNATASCNCIFIYYKPQFNGILCFCVSLKGINYCSRSFGYRLRRQWFLAVLNMIYYIRRLKKHKNGHWFITYFNQSRRLCQGAPLADYRVKVVRE